MAGLKLSNVSQLVQEQFLVERRTLAQPYDVPQGYRGDGPLSKTPASDPGRKTASPEGRGAELGERRDQLRWQMLAAAE